MFPALNESKKWHYFTDATGNEYLLLLSSVAMGTSRLYQWKGTFVLTQTISTFGAQSADSYTFSDNHTVLAIANSEGDSTVYELVDQSLVVVRPNGLLTFQSIIHLNSTRKVIGVLGLSLTIYPTVQDVLNVHKRDLN